MIRLSVLSWMKQQCYYIIKQTFSQYYFHWIFSMYLFIILYLSNESFFLPRSCFSNEQVNKQSYYLIAFIFILNLNESHLNILMFLLKNSINEICFLNTYCMKTEGRQEVACFVSKQNMGHIFHKHLMF